MIIDGLGVGIRWYSSTLFRIEKKRFLSSSVYKLLKIDENGQREIEESM